MHATMMQLARSCVTKIRQIFDSDASWGQGKHLAIALPEDPQRTDARLVLTTTEAEPGAAIHDFGALHGENVIPAVVT